VQPACGRVFAPQRIVAFSSIEEWARDVTTEVALKVLKEAIARGRKLPKPTREMVERAIDADVPAEVRE
jgi:hypothetical protein